MQSFDLPLHRSQHRARIQMTEYTVRRKPCDLLLGRGAERSMPGQTFQQRERGSTHTEPSPSGYDITKQQEGRPTSRHSSKNISLRNGSTIALDQRRIRISI